MKAFYSLLAMWLGLTVGMQAQNRHLGKDTPKTALDPTADYIAIYQEAKRSYDAGKLADAEQQAQFVLGTYPHYAPAVTLLKMIRRADDGTSGQIGRKLDRIIIPRVNFRDALVESALDFLRDETRRLDPEKKGVNIVPNIPDDIKKRKITLDLVDVSAADLLRYIAEVGGFRYRIERSAVLISSDEPVKPGTPAAPATVADDPSQSLLPVIPGGP